MSLPATADANPQTAYIALGSNLDSGLGSPAQTVLAAIGRLGELGRVLAQSSLYETEPVGVHGQPLFINAVVAMATNLEPGRLLDGMLSLEREFGRRRGPRRNKEARTLDLDLLFMEQLVVSSERLTLPHPALPGRRFVLAPLAEIAPRLRHPLLGKSVAELLALLPDRDDNRISAVRRLGWMEGA